MWEGIYTVLSKFTEILFKQLSEGNFAKKQTCFPVGFSETEALTAHLLCPLPTCDWIAGWTEGMRSDWMTGAWLSAATGMCRA